MYVRTLFFFGNLLVAAKFGYDWPKLTLSMGLFDPATHFYFLNKNVWAGNTTSIRGTEVHRYTGTQVHRYREVQLCVCVSPPLFKTNEDLRF